MSSAERSVVVERPEADSGDAAPAAGRDGTARRRTGPAAGSATGPSRRGEGLRLLAAAGIPTVVFFFVILKDLAYAWDDFIQFGVTMDAGLSRDLLTYDLFEHFGPLNRLTHGVLVLGGGLDSRWSLLVTVPVFFGFCLALADLARALGASWRRTTLALVLATVTPATVHVAAILDPYFHVMVPVAAMAAATAAYVRWTRDRRLVHAATGALMFLVACLTQERGVFLLLFLVLARLLVIAGGVPVRRWVGTLLRDWPFLLVPGLVAVGTALVVALFYAAEDSPRGGLRPTASFVAHSWTDQFVPMLTGTFGAGDGSLHTALVVAANLAVVALVAATVLRDRWNVRPWLLMAVWFGFMTAFVGLGRLGLATAEYLLADPQYYAYMLPAVVVVVATLRPPAPETAEAASGRPALPVLGAQWAGVAVLAALVLVESVPVAARVDLVSPGYLAAGVPQVLAANDAGPVSIAPTRAPAGLVPGGYSPYNNGEYVLAELDPRTTVDLDPDAPRFLDWTGQLREGTADLLSRVTPDTAGAQWSTADPDGRPNGESCLPAGGPGDLRVSLPEPVSAPAGVFWVRLTTSGGESDGQVTVWSDDAVGTGQGPDLTTAHGTSTLAVPADAASGVALLNVTSSHELCVDAIEVWALSASTANGCAWVGLDGDPVAPRPDERTPRCTS